MSQRKQNHARLPGQLKTFFIASLCIHGVLSPLPCIAGNVPVLRNWFTLGNAVYQPSSGYIWSAIVQICIAWCARPSADGRLCRVLMEWWLENQQTFMMYITLFKLCLLRRIPHRVVFSQFVLSNFRMHL